MNANGPDDEPASDYSIPATFLLALFIGACTGMALAFAYVAAGGGTFGR